MSVSANGDSADTPRPEFLRGANTKREVADKICDELLSQARRFERRMASAYLLADAVGYQIASERRGSLIFAGDGRGMLCRTGQKEVLEGMGDELGEWGVRLEKYADDLCDASEEKLHGVACRIAKTLLSMAISADEAQTEAGVLRLARSQAHAVAYISDQERRHSDTEGNVKIHQQDLFSRAENAPEVKGISDFENALFNDCEWLRELRKQLDHAFPSKR